MLSGDSTINADIVMFSNDISLFSILGLNDFSSSNDKINLLRTYNIVKSFIG